MVKKITKKKIKIAAAEHRCMFDPKYNDNVVILEMQKDGNWVALGKRFGKIVRVREGMPDHALTRFLTHE